MWLKAKLCKFLSIRTASFAIALLAFALVATTAMAYLPVMKPFNMPKTARAKQLTAKPEWVSDQVNPSQAQMAEPNDPQERVRTCWGYLGRKKVIEAIRLFFQKGIYPSVGICRGFNKIHKDCFPDMFSIWDFVNPKRIPFLRSHCFKVVRDSPLPTIED